MDMDRHMSATIPNSDTPNWIIAPAVQCVNLIGEETKLAAVLQRAVIALSYQGVLLKAARKHIKTTKLDAGVIDKLILEQKTGLELLASELIIDDFHLINKHGLIGMWVAVEVAVEDTIVLILTKDESAFQLIVNAGIKLPSHLSGPLSEPEARRIYKKLERQRHPGNSVAEEYIRMLALFGISVTLPPSAISSLAELNYVRNCFLHRAGIVDERSVAEAPTLPIEIGTPIKISSTRYIHYLDSVGEFARALLAGGLGSRYIRSQPKVTS